MDDYLRNTKVIADSIASVQDPLSNKELINCTIRGQDEVYEPLVTTIIYSSGNPSFDEFWMKLLQYEQRILYLRGLNDNPSHQAFAATTTGGKTLGVGCSNTAQSLGAATSSGSGRGRGNRCNKKKRGRSGQGNATTPGQQQQQFPTSILGHPTGYAFSNSVGSYSNTVVSFASRTNNYCAGNYPSGAAISSSPNTQCYICFCPGHGATASPQRYASRTNQTMVPAFDTFNPGETSDTMWFLDSIATSHMTPSEGIFSSKSVYTGSMRVRIVDGTLLPIAAIGDAALRPVIVNLPFMTSIMSRVLKTIYYLSSVFVTIIIVWLVLTLPVSVKDRPTGKFLLQELAWGMSIRCGCLLQSLKPRRTSWRVQLSVRLLMCGTAPVSLRFCGF